MAENEKKFWESLISDKKKLTWLVTALCIGIVFMFVGSIKTEEKKSDEPNIDDTRKDVLYETSLNAIAKAEQSLERRLEKILSKIEGVGKVSATVFLEESPEYQYAVNVSTTEKKIDEADQNGGTRITTEYNEDGQLVLVRSGGGEEPIVVKEIKPEIQGVLVVAEGAEDPLIREKIARALQTLLDVSPAKVSVLEGR